MLRHQTTQLLEAMVQDIAKAAAAQSAAWASPVTGERVSSALLAAAARVASPELALTALSGLQNSLSETPAAAAVTEKATVTPSQVTRYVRLGLKACAGAPDIKASLAVLKALERLPGALDVHWDRLPRVLRPSCGLEDYPDLIALARKSHILAQGACGGKDGEGLQISLIKAMRRACATLAERTFARRSRSRDMLCVVVPDLRKTTSGPAAGAAWLPTTHKEWIISVRLSPSRPTEHAVVVREGVAYRACLLSTGGQLAAASDSEEDTVFGNFEDALSQALVNMRAAHGTPTV
jgi:hypothetical protein